MFKRILYPTDFSGPAERAMEYVKHLRGAGGEEVIVLHIVDRRGLDDLARFSKRDIAQIQEDLNRKATVNIEQVAKELRKTGFAVRIMIERGGPSLEISRVADEEDVSVIVVGSRGTGNIEDMLLGSVSYKLVKRTRKPVLIIKS